MYRVYRGGIVQRTLETNEAKLVPCVDPSRIRRAEVVHFIANTTKTTASVVGAVAIGPTGESL